MELQQQFEAAVAESKTLAQKPDNETLLKMYSFYKQGVDGDINIDEPTNMFDFVGKAKYNAWNALKGMSKEDAMSTYINLVKELKG